VRYRRQSGLAGFLVIRIFKRISPAYTYSTRGAAIRMSEAAMKALVPEDNAGRPRPSAYLFRARPPSAHLQAPIEATRMPIAHWAHQRSLLQLLLTFGLGLHQSP
jgi:hypothetical protein